MCHKKTHSAFAFKSQAGSTLLEMLISLFVMGVGMMGVLAMQTQSVRLNQQAYSYSQAVFLAQDILESMRANRDAAKSYKIAEDEKTSSSLDCGKTDAKCNAVQMKDWDISRWRKSIAARLPGGTSSIGLNDDTFTINIVFYIVNLNKENLIGNPDVKKQTYTLTAGL